MDYMNSVDQALSSLRNGKMVALYDSDEREKETDLAFHASFATPKMIEMLRRDAGGLICVAIGADIAEQMNLPFYTDILASSNSKIMEMECTKTAYKDKPAFAIPINHKGVYTGITDNDRALTIKKLAELVESGGELYKGLVGDFYSPGHVFLLRGRGIENRRGQTELSLELARRAGMSGVMVLCEMLGQGTALSKENVNEYAKKNEIVFLEGRDIYG